MNRNPRKYRIDCAIGTEKIKEAIRVTDEEEAAIKEHHGVDDKNIKFLVKYLIKWMCKQPHLPVECDKERLERFLLRNSFYMTKAKHTIDGYYTMHGRYPEYFVYMNPKSTLSTNLEKSCILAVLPNLSPALQRIFFFKFLPDEPQHFDSINIIRYFFSIMDLCLQCDYSLGERIVIDLEHLTDDHLANLNAKDLDIATQIFRHGFGRSLKSVDFINAKSFSTTILSYMSFMGVKGHFLLKVRFHESVESLSVQIPIEYLPTDYGGKQGYLKELKGEMDRLIEAHERSLRENAEKFSFEELRNYDNLDRDIYGIQGKYSVVDTLIPVDLFKQH